MFSKQFKNAIKSFYPVKEFLEYYYREAGVIFMMHRIAEFEEDKIAPNENMKISSQFLENLINTLSYDYSFISLDELFLILSTGKTLKKKFAVFTFDDGYVDNYSNAFPIFKKYGIPFTIYLTTGFIDRKAILWWYTIEDLILKYDNIELSDGSVLRCSNLIEKTESFYNLRNKIINISGNKLENSLKQLFKNYNLDFQQKVNELTLSWEQIIEMSNSGLCTIAAHSVSHPTFNLLSEEELHFEVMECKKIIESTIYKEVFHFAYPFGTSVEIGQREHKLINKLPFKTVTRASGGKILQNKKYDLHNLPRFNLTENFSF